MDQQTNLQVDSSRPPSNDVCIGNSPVILTQAVFKDFSINIKRKKNPVSDHNVCIGNSPVRLDGDQKCTRSPANVNKMLEKTITNLKKPCSYRDLCDDPVFSQCSPPSVLRFYWDSWAWPRRSRRFLTKLVGFLPRVFYMYRDCTATS